MTVRELLYSTINDHSLSEFDQSTEERLSELIQLFQRQLDANTNVGFDDLSATFNTSEIPETPVSPADYLDFLSDVVVPHAIQTASPRSLGHMTCALPQFMQSLGKLIIAMNQNMVKIEASRTLTLLEREALAMMHRLVYERDETFYSEHMHHTESTLGIITSGGTVANITALWCARNQRLGRHGDFAGVSNAGLAAALTAYGATRAVVIGSSLMHYSFDKAADILGIGAHNLIKLPVGPDNRLDPVLVEQTIIEQQRQGAIVLALVGIAGTTDTASVDPLDQLAALARRYGIHFHVDAAWGGPLLFSAQHKAVLKGIMQADSVTIDGHKQLYLPLGIGVLLLRDPQLGKAIEKHANYIIRAGSPDLGKRTLEGSRPANALYLHAGLHLLGSAGYGALIDSSLQTAQLMTAHIRRHPAFELLVEPQLNILVYRYIPTDLRSRLAAGQLTHEDNLRINQLNEQLQDAQRQAGRSFVSRTTLYGTRYGPEMPIVALRAVVANPLICEDDIEAVLGDQLELAERVVLPRLQAGIPRRRSLARAPLSLQQQRLWVLNRWDPADTTQHVAIALRLSGELDSAAFVVSLAEVIKRHEGLRTVFALDEGQPVQVILPELLPNLVVHDLLPLPYADRADELAHLIEAERERLFDLLQGPLLRTTLIHSTPDEHLFLVVCHQIIADHDSLLLLVRELAQTYSAVLDDQVIPLSEPLIHYADFAEWQRAHVLAGGLADQQRSWRAQLTPLPAPLELPLDRPRPAFQSPSTAFLEVVLPPMLQAKIQNIQYTIQNDQGLSDSDSNKLELILLSAWQVLLMRYSRQHDLVIGVPVSSRTRPESATLIGSFDNQLLCRVDLSDNPSFLTLVSRTEHTMQLARANQEYPFALGLEALQIERNLSYAPIAQAQFSFQQLTETAWELPDLHAQLAALSPAAISCDLALSVLEKPSGLTCTLHYQHELFEASTIERMAEQLITLLEGICEDPATPIATLPLLRETERQQLLVAWNATAVAYPQDHSIAELFAAQALRTPDAVAFRCADQSITYDELHRRSNQLAHYLQSQGVGPEVPVAVCLERSFELVIALLATLKAGGIYAPLDPAHYQRAEFVLHDLQAPVLLTSAAIVPQLPPHASQLLCLDADWSRIAHASEATPRSQSGLDQAAYIIYTSGSTGTPKGVILPQRQLLNRFNWMWINYPFAQDEISSYQVSPSFVDSLWEMLGPLLQGITTVIIPLSIQRDVTALVATMAAQSITRTWISPSSLQLILNSYPDLAKRIPHVRFWVSTGEAIPADLCRRFYAQLPGCQLFNLYGTSEVYDATWWDTTAEQGNVWHTPIGRPIDNVQLYVFDAALQPVPVGVPGELLIGGVGVARGYYHRPELTAERFIPSPFAEQPGARLYRTGDLVRYRPDGALEYLGRMDQQVKVNGMRIELEEIESVIRRASGVEQAVVIVREDQPGKKRLVAYLIAPEPDVVSALRTSLKQLLPSYMHPSVYVLLDQFPLTASGKINRRELPAPSHERSFAEQGFVAARTELERELAELWCSMLDLSEVGVHDNFFALGGQSLQAIELIFSIRDKYEIELPLQSLFTAMTIAELAIMIDG